MARIAVDAMGGDFAPRAPVAGALQALAALPGELRIQLVGRTAEIEAELDALLAGELSALASQRARIDLVDAPDVIEMTDKPSVALRGKTASSMVIGIRRVAEGQADAFVSAGNTGAQMGGWFRKEINTVDDLKGLKFRVGGFAGEILTRLGVVPQQIGAGDIYPALEKGTIDAAEWVGPYDDEKLGFNKVARFYHYPGWWEGASVGSLYIGQKHWDALPKSYQAMVETAAGLVSSWMVPKYDAVNPAALKRLVAGGTVLKPFSRPVLEACYNASWQYYEEVAGRNANFKKMLDSIKAFRGDEITWFRVAEGTFDSFINAMNAAGR